MSNHKIKFHKTSPNMIFVRCSCGWNTARDPKNNGWQEEKDCGSPDNERGFKEQFGFALAHVGGSDQ